jgi:hypothetical protein
MATDITTPRTRRALLGAAVGAVGAAVIGGLAAPQRALAGGNDGAPVLVGSQFFDVRGLTILSNASTNADVFNASTSGSGKGITGSSGSGYGVYGQSTSAIGVFGYSGTATAVRGDSPSGVAVWGVTTTGIGLEGTADQPGGQALHTSGRIRADQVSGVATIAAGHTSVTLTPGVDVVGASFVLLTPMTKLSGRDLWFTKSTTANSITIHLSSARPVPTKVAWLLLG